MDTIRSVLGYDTQAHADQGTTGDQLGELVQNKQGDSTSTSNHGGAAPQHTSGTGNSGVEPISGKLGSGTAGQPYDAGNEEGLTGHGGNSSSTGSGLTGALGGHSSRGAGYEGTSTSGYGNDKPSTLSGLASSLTGSSNRGTGHEGTSGLTDSSNRGNDKSSMLSGLASSLTGNSNHGTGHEGVSGLTGNSNRGTGYEGTSGLTGNSNRGTGYEGTSGLTGNSNRGTGYEGTSGLTGNSGPTSGYENTSSYGNTPSGYSGGSVPNPTAAGYESTSGYGNNTGYEDSTSRGIGAEAPQQANHYESTATAGRLPNALGMDAVHVVGGTPQRTTVNDSSYGRDSNYGSDPNHGRESSHHHDHTHGNDSGLLQADTSSGYGKGLLGSDRGAGQSSDRYLFDAKTAPGAGGRHHHIVDDYTDANIHHEGAGRIHEGLGSDANAGQAGAGAGVVAGTGAGIANLESDSRPRDTGKERARKPGFGRLGSNVGYGSHGLNSGAPRESIGQRMEQKAEYAAAPLAGLAGAGAVGYGATRSGTEPLSGGPRSGTEPLSGGPRSGTEPLSGARGSGVAGEPYDQGNRYDGAGVTQREKQYGSGSGYGHDGVSEATSGVNNMNLRDQNRSSDFQVITPDGAPYPGTGRGVDNSSDNFSRSQDSNITGAGLAGVGAGVAGAGAAGHHHHDHHHDHHNTNTSSAGYGSSGDGILEQRIAGAPVPDDNCETTHHSTHPTGEDAHIDPTHKSTFLDYRHDHFGLPVAKGE